MTNLTATAQSTRAKNEVKNEVAGLRAKNQVAGFPTRVLMCYPV